VRYREGSLRPHEPIPEGTNHLLDALTPEDRRALEASSRPISLGRKEVLHEPGDPAARIVFPTAGLVSLLTLTEDGDATEIAMVGREGAVGVEAFLGANTTTGRAMVQNEGQAVEIDAGPLRERARTSEPLREVLYRFVQALLVSVGQSVACNQLHRVEQRLARWLMASYDRVGARTLPYTHEFLADILGVRRASVTEAAVRFQEAGVLEYSRGRVVITDPQGLAARACECYRVIGDALSKLLPAG
jgi:CRP-like cAMP-binding protein